MNSALIIDDDPIQIEVVSAQLRTFGLTEIASATTGREAQQLLSASDGFDVLILDLNMPDFDGVEFLDVLREQNFAAPIVIVSGAHESVRAGAAGLAKAKGLNVTGVLSKPVSLDKLREAITEA